MDENDSKTCGDEPPLTTSMPGPGKLWLVELSSLSRVRKPCAPKMRLELRLIGNSRVYPPFTLSVSSWWERSSRSASPPFAWFVRRSMLLPKGRNAVERVAVKSTPKVPSRLKFDVGM